jgi:hypothetical protein
MDSIKKIGVPTWHPDCCLKSICSFVLVSKLLALAKQTLIILDKTLHRRFLHFSKLEFILAAEALYHVAEFVCY